MNAKSLQNALDGLKVLYPNITVGEFKRQLALLDVPDDAVIKFQAKEQDWKIVEHFSFCRSENEVTIW